MIDTDKYEGHTEGPWVMDEQKRHIIIMNQLIGLRFVDMEIDANAQLIADAPLILQALIDKQEEYTRFTLYAEAEIKRLRDAIAVIANEIEGAELGYESTYVVRNPYTSKDVLQPRKIFEDLRKVIQ